MCNQANPNLPRFDNGTLMKFSFPGLYPIFYVCANSSVLCPICANKQESDDRQPDAIIIPQFQIEAADINYESCDLYCDQCSIRIESAYTDCDAPADES